MTLSTRLDRLHRQQESILVGCIPPALKPYMLQVQLIPQDVVP